MKNWSVGLLAAGAWLLAGCDGGAMPAVGADDDGDVGAVAAEPEGDVASLPAGDEQGDVESSVPAILLPEPLPQEPILLPEPLPQEPILLPEPLPQEPILLPEPLPQEPILLPGPSPKPSIGKVPCVGACFADSPNLRITPSW